MRENLMSKGINIYSTQIIQTLRRHRHWLHKNIPFKSVSSKWCLKIDCYLMIFKTNTWILRIFFHICNCIVYGTSNWFIIFSSYFSSINKVKFSILLRLRWMVNLHSFRWSMIQIRKLECRRRADPLHKSLYRMIQCRLLLGHLQLLMGLQNHPENQK